MADSHRADAWAGFQKDTADHVLVIAHEDGVYRHLHVRKPGTSCYGFDIVTWPGHLAISGDMGCDVFARTLDMLKFFRPSSGDYLANAAERRGELPINPSYWAEKIQSGRDNTEFDPGALRDLVAREARDYIESHTEDAAPTWAGRLIDQVTELVATLEDTSVAGAIRELDAFRPDTFEYSLHLAPGEEVPPAFAEFRFSEPWDHSRSLERWTFHYLWRCYAIVWAVREYDAQKATTAVDDAPARVEA